MGIVTNSRTRNGGIRGDLPPGARLMERVARPLNGLEVVEGVREHLREIARAVIERNGGLGEHGEKNILEMDSKAQKELQRYGELNRMNLVYPNVCWQVQLSLQKDGDEWNLVGSVEVDLERNRQVKAEFGEAIGSGWLDHIEDEQLQSRVPDQVRADRGLKVEADYIVPDTNTRGKVELEVPRSQRAVARSVDLKSTEAARLGVNGALLIPQSPSEKEYQERVNQEAIKRLEAELESREKGKVEEKKVGDGGMIEGTERLERVKNEIPIEEIIEGVPKVAAGKVAPRKVSLIPPHKVKELKEEKKDGKL